MDKDFYASLGLNPDATPEAIKKTYRKLAQKFHPDHYHNRSEEERARANDRMVEITEAFRILSNPTERAAYDQKRAEEQARLQTHAAAARASAVRTHTSSKLGRDISQDFLGKLFAQLRSGHDGVQWKEQQSQSRDWMRSLHFSNVSASFFLQFYKTQQATPSLARQFVRNAETFVESRKSLWRNTYYIFVLAFENVASPDEVMATCNRFTRLGKSGLWAQWRAVIVLLDTLKTRSVFCGRPMPVDSLKRTFQILQGRR